MEFEGRSRISLELNLAPLIDVVLLLLIFFMLTSSYMVAEAIDLELPFSESSRLIEDGYDIIVTLEEDGSIYVNSEAIARADLVKTLEQLLVTPDTQTITLKTDSDESVQDMIDLMDMIRAAGGQKVLIATQGAKPTSQKP